MRILVLNYEFPPIGGGGGRVSEDLCRALAARGHAIRVATGGMAGTPMHEDRDGYEIYRYRSLRRRADSCTPLEMAAFLATSCLPAFWHAVTWRPHVIHAHFAVPTGALAWLISVTTGIPYVLTIHLGDVPGGVPEQTDHIFRLIKPLTVPIWKRATSVIAVSEHVRRLASESYDVPIETIPNGIELRPSGPDERPANGLKRLVFAGRFNPQKNVLFLIDVLDRIRDLPWQADLVGDGPLRQAIEQDIKRRHLADRILLHGWVPLEVVDSVMSQGDVLVLPSLSEGMPVVGVQALGFGLAIVGSDTGGMAEIVHHGVNGLLCPVADAQAFEQALRVAVTSDARLAQMKRESKQLAVNFDLKHIARRYEQVLQAAAK